MRRPLVYTLITFALLTALLPIGQPPTTVHDGQSKCVDQTVQGADILVRKQLDVNQDGIQDDVVIYGNDDLYVLVAINLPTVSCQVVLNDSLTARQIYAGERRPVTVKQVELVDLTGDDRPELHIGLEGTYFFRESGTFHAIYMLQGKNMQRIFVSDQCLPMSSFEFRVAPDGAKLVYLDEDRRCDPPSSSRDYEIYRWNAKTSQFESIESGQIAKWTEDPFWTDIVLPVVVVAIGGLIGIIVWSRIKKKRANTAVN